MPHINVLSKEVSELIAAGEVIERPSSVIKELVENSIDSGARHITVEIKNGGTTYMRVTDDGCGMAFDDVPTAFLRHATSKISEKTDLETIGTLGFRGEALASVAAVSKVEVMTKLRDETYGTIYGIEGSVETMHERGGCPDGTTLIIRDLFYNVPARRKFMKRDVTEANAVSQIMQKITMSHPSISFRMIRDNRTEFTSSGDGELYSAIYAVYGRDFVRDLIPMDYDYNGVHVGGYTVKPLYSKNNRAFQNFFVNGRYVRSRLCSAALENAYTNMIMTGKFPACVMLIDLPPADMDVNIHPTKAEVRFTNEKNVSDAIFFAVKNAMMNDGLIYEFQLKPPQDWTKKPEEEYVQPSLFTPVSEIASIERTAAPDVSPQTSPASAPQTVPENKPTATPQPAAVEERPYAETAPVTDNAQPAAYVPKPAPTADAPDEEYETAEIEPVRYDEPATPTTAAVPETVAEPVKDEKIEGFSYISTKSFERAPEPVQTVSEAPAKPEIRIIGEAFKTYVIAEIDNNVIMIDKHAAHERILFEEMRARNCRQYSQMLMNGVKVLLTNEEFSAIESNTELLADLGFTFDFSERPCVIATAVPTFVIELDIEEIISEIAENLRLFRHDPQPHILDDMLHTMACKAAIKGNDDNDVTELKKLVEQVWTDERIRHCPHGRPVMFTMSKSNIEHQFGRA